MTVGDTLSALSVVTAPLLYVYELFEKLLQSTNMTAVYSAAILVLLVVRFILMPIVGSFSVGRGSDIVDNRTTKSSSHSDDNRKV